MELINLSYIADKTDITAYCLYFSGRFNECYSYINTQQKSGERLSVKDIEDLRYGIIEST